MPNPHPPQPQPPTISLVIPARNEAERLPPYLAAIRAHFQQHCAGSYEVIVVDDGSTDGLDAVLARLQSDWPSLAIVRHPHGRGKGAAIRGGMQAATGRLLLFADADGATPIEEEQRLRAAIAGGADVAVGSRLAPGDGVTRRRAFWRGMVGRLFAVVARTWLRLGVRDTQCGFKMFAGDCGRQLFALARENGYLLDLELLVLADRLGHRVEEVPVSWSEQPGSRLRASRELGKILRGLRRLRRLRARPTVAEPGTQAQNPGTQAQNQEQ